MKHSSSADFFLPSPPIQLDTSLKERRGQIRQQLQPAQNRQARNRSLEPIEQIKNAGAKGLSVTGNQKRLVSYREDLTPEAEPSIQWYEGAFNGHDRDVQDVLTAMHQLSDNQLSGHRGVQSQLQVQESQPVEQQPERQRMKQKGRNSRNVKSALGLVESDQIRLISNVSQAAAGQQTATKVSAGKLNQMPTLYTESSPVREARSLIRQQKEQEAAIEGRIRYLQSQDQKIHRQVDKARNLATKKKVTQKARVLHEMLVKRNYDQKVRDMNRQAQLVAERKEYERKNQGHHAKYLQTKKQQVAKQQKEVRNLNLNSIRQSKELDVHFNQVKANSVKQQLERIQVQKQALDAQQKTVNEMNRKARIEKLQKEIHERNKSLSLIEKKEIEALETHKRTINYKRNEMAKLASAIGEDPLGSQLESIEERSFTRKNLLSLGSQPRLSPPKKRKKLDSLVSRNNKPGRGGGSLEQSRTVNDVYLDMSEGLTGWGTNSPPSQADVPKRNDFIQAKNSVQRRAKKKSVIEDKYQDPARDHMHYYNSAQKPYHKMDVLRPQEYQPVAIGSNERRSPSIYNKNVFTLTQGDSDNKSDSQIILTNLDTKVVLPQRLVKPFSKQLTFIDKNQSPAMVSNRHDQNQMDKMHQSDLTTMVSPGANTSNTGHTSGPKLTRNSLLPGISQKTSLSPKSTNYNLRTSNASFQSRQKRYNVWQRLPDQGVASPIQIHQNIDIKFN